MQVRPSPGPFLALWPSRHRPVPPRGFRPLPSSLGSGKQSAVPAPAAQGLDHLRNAAPDQVPAAAGEHHQAHRGYGLGGGHTGGLSPGSLGFLRPSPAHPSAGGTRSLSAVGLVAIQSKTPAERARLGGSWGGEISLLSGSSGLAAVGAWDVAGSWWQRAGDSPVPSRCCCPLSRSRRSAVAAGTSEHDKLCRARDQCRDILKYVNEAVKRAENRHRLEGYQKRLDATSLERTSNPLAAEFKVAPGQRRGAQGGLPGPR